MKIEIVQKKMKNKTDCFFYESEIAIAVATKPNGTKLSLIAEGEIRIIIDGEEYRNNQIQDAIKKYKLTDKKLNKLNEEGKLTWENNNWFEVIWLPKGAKSWECEIGDVVYDYDSAIELLKGYYENEEI